MNNIRLVVSGLANAGKTIFISQIIAHLEHYVQAHFSLGSGRIITDVKHVPLQHPEVKPFPYKQVRACLLGSDPEWPSATREITGIGIEFTLVDQNSRPFWKRSGRHPHRLEIYDFPGELLGDLNIPDRSFEQWSEDALSRLHDRTLPMSAVGQGYLSLLSHLDRLSPQTLVEKYHQVLEAALRKGATSITPAGWISSRGEPMTAAMLNFAPLPPGAPSGLRETFVKGFHVYGKWLTPLSDIFGRCDHHVILVDVLDILRNGQARYVERQKALQEIINFYAQSHGYFQRIARRMARQVRIPVKAPRSPLSKAIVVATKADAVMEDDRGRLSGLLQEMLETELRSLGINVDVDFRTCAAFDATERQTDGSRRVIIGRVPSAPDQKQPREVTRVPESWPNQAWDGSEFRSFRTYLPPRPTSEIRKDALFPHINLNEIVRAALSLA